MRFDPKYKNLSLLVTTGPGPVPSLDGENIVVGSVLGALRSRGRGGRAAAVRGMGGVGVIAAGGRVCVQGGGELALPHAAPPQHRPSAHPRACVLLPAPPAQRAWA